jgi:hypothetical protein
MGNLKSILDIMEELAAAGATPEEILSIFFMAKQRVEMSSAVAAKRDKIMAALREYLIELCGECDDDVMREFENGLIGFEKVYQQVNIKKKRDNDNE